ncbi:MAG: MmcQ/YjbR family DNA-binding protein [Gammaproteobacteria bacterium]|nr:MmcQ/YjbR family DNA-binding protein [Gammaproteobacteria bacterium]
MTKRTPTEAILELCLAFEGSENANSHGMKDFRVRNKVFAYYTVNHHGDGRVALWLNAPEGAQGEYLAMDDESYFQPPYMGKKGWLGINLDKHLSWDEIQLQVTEAYLHTTGLDVNVEEIMPDVEPPNAPIDPVEFDAFNDPTCAKRLKEIRAMCFALPEVHEGTQFGTPAFKAGKKTFATAYVLAGQPCAEIWVGRDQQPALTEDERFIVPRYTGHNGWIQFALKGEDCMEILQDLLLDSYKHFALKRMVAALAEA